MPTLPSGIAIALDESRLNQLFADEPTSSSIEKLPGIRKHSDLFPLIDILFFAPAGAVDPSKVAEFSSDAAELAGLKAYFSGYNLASFAEYYGSLDESDQLVFTNFLKSDRVQTGFTRLLYRAAAARKRLKLPPWYAPDDSMTTEERIVFKPDDFGIQLEKLFPSEIDSWNRSASQDGYLRLRPSVFIGISGLEGSLALGNPPSETALDCWEASKPAGVWDYWSFLSFITVPSSNNGEKKLVIFFEGNTFFDRPLEIIAELELDSSDGDWMDAREEVDMLREEWAVIFEKLTNQFRAAPLDGKKWLSGESLYGIDSPDQ